MSSFIAPRPAPSLPANETTPLSPKHTPRDPTKTFSKMMSHLKLGHENTEHKMDAQKTPTSRRASVAARASTNENPKRLSSILTHLVLPPSEQPTLKPSPKHKTTNQPPPNNPVLPTQTRYVDMLLGLDEVPRSHNLLASFSTWILLAGYIVVPGTFVSIEHSKALREGATHNHVEHALLDTVKHTSLIWVASLCCAVGATGMIWLWWRWRQNYVWLINKIFLVGLLNSLAGVISTLINVYSQQGGRFSITARITMAVTTSCTLVTAVLYFLYNFWILQGVRKKHEQELELESQKRATVYK